MTTYRAKAFGLLLVALGLLLASSPASAADDGRLTWGVAPADDDSGSARPNFVYTANPGDVIHDGLVVTNLGAEPLTLAVYAADALTTSSGQLDLLPAGAPSADLGTWVKLTDDSVEVAAGASRTVPFTVTVPDDATPGDHSGGVVTSYVASQSGSPVALDSRLGSRMHVRVSGELTPAVTVSGAVVDFHPTVNPFAPSSATVTYTVTNTGNTRVAATDEVRVAGPLGTAPATVDGSLPELLPGSVLVRRVEVPGVWPTVRISAEVDVLAEGVGIGGRPLPPTTVSAGGWAAPWTALALVVLVVGGALLASNMRDRREDQGDLSSGTTAELSKIEV